MSEDPLGFKGGNVDFYVYAGNNPLIINDPLGLLDWLMGSGGSLVGGTGVEGSAGIFIGQNDETNALEGGPFLSLGGGGGLNVSADLLFFGVANQINGPTINTNYTASIFSLTVFHDPNTGEVVGGTAGVGPPGPTPIGFSMTYSETGGWDVIGAVRNFIFGAPSGSGTDPSQGLPPSDIFANPPPLFAPQPLPSEPSIGPQSSLGSPAAGGFVLYPSRPNLNSVERAYAK